MDDHHIEEEEKTDDPSSGSGAENEIEMNEGDRTIMTDSDETHVTEDDETHMTEGPHSHVFTSTPRHMRSQSRTRSRRIMSDSDEDMGESSQHFDDFDTELVSHGQSSQQEDSMPHTQKSGNRDQKWGGRGKQRPQFSPATSADEGLMFDEPIANAFDKIGQSRSHVRFTDTDSVPLSSQGLDDAGSESQAHESQETHESQSPDAEAPDATELGQDPGASQSQRDQRQENRAQKEKSFADAFHRTKRAKEQIKENQAKGKVPSPTKKRKDPKNSSFVWKFAEKFKAGEELKTRCKLCGNEWGHAGSSTSNLSRHIKNHHKAHYARAKGEAPASEEQQQLKIDNLLKKTQTWKRDSKNSIEMDRSIVRFVASTNQPLSVIENNEFREILPKEYQPPNRHTFTTLMLHNAYLFTKGAVQAMMSSNPNMFMGCQVDHTTAGNYDQFGSFCVQFLDEDFKLHSLSTGTFPYTGQHTGDALYDSCEGDHGLVKEWSLDKFTRVYTTDSYTGNKKGFDNKHDIYWLPCLAHQMHNTVKAGLSKCEPVKTLHSKMRRILEFCHKSPVQLRFIKGNAKWLGLPELTVKSECPTRWNSFMVSCERFIVIYDPLNVTLSNAGKDDLILTADDLSLMKELVTELMPFRDITNMLCVNTTYSFNNYLPMVDGIRRKLAKK